MSFTCMHNGCGKAFTKIDNLQTHVREHTKDKNLYVRNVRKSFLELKIKEDMKLIVPGNSSYQVEEDILNICEWVV